MRELLVALGLMIFSTQLNAQQVDSPYVAPYVLPVPEGWSTEIISFPIEFAPSINYHGVEDLRFTAGWGNVQTDEYWTYAFLWWLQGTPEFNETIVGDNLKAYYTGLVGRNIKPRNIPENKIFPVQVTLRASTVTGDDLQTFDGSVYMLDYMTQKPITLHVHVHVKNCSEANRTVIFNEISPQPFNHAVWSQLDAIWTGFKCTK